ncbi:MAG: dihydroorotate dehydrogenase electron transfer subunit [Candidatus Omnitrophota bacterium]
MKAKKYDEDVLLLENKKVNEKYFKLVFRSKALSKDIKPGQFLHVRVNQGQDPFLRRPFSYFRVSPGRVEVLYEVLGRGTSILSGKKKGDFLRVMGPLGNAFTKDLGKKKRILVAGGVGVPPLVFLAEKYPTAYLLVGTKSKAELMSKSELKKVRAQLLFTTEDGSYGTKGRVTLLLEEILKDQHPEEFYIQTCGPKRMMEAVIAIAAKYGVEGEASWDESMACGVGACLGCMVKTRTGLKRACADGPVFKFEDLET